MISEVNISAQRLAKNRVLAQYWSVAHATFRNVSPMSEDTCKAFYFEIGASVVARRPKTWKNESKTMILCKEVTFFGTSRYRKIGRTGWPIGEIYQVMVLRVSPESNLFRKTNHSTTKTMSVEIFLFKHWKTRWNKDQNWTVFYLVFSQKTVIGGRGGTETWIFCYASHLDDSEKLLKHLRNGEGAWGAKWQHFFMNGFFRKKYRLYAIRGAFSPLRRQLPGDRET